jgi:hypothetical protein
VNIQNHIEKKPINSILMTMQSDKQKKNILTKGKKKRKKCSGCEKICNNNNRGE